MGTWALVTRIGLALPEAEPGEAHEGSPALMVGSRQFARLRLSDEGREILQFWVADPELVHAYVDEDPETFYGAPGYSKKVVMARLDRLDDAFVPELLIESWRCRASASVARRNPEVG